MSLGWDTLHCMTIACSVVQKWHNSYKWMGPDKAASILNSSFLDIPSFKSPVWSLHVLSMSERLQSIRKHWSNMHFQSQEKARRTYDRYMCSCRFSEPLITIPLQALNWSHKCHHRGRHREAAVYCQPLQRPLNCPADPQCVCVYAVHMYEWARGMLCTS